MKAYTKILSIAFIALLVGSCGKKSSQPAPSSDVSTNTGSTSEELDLSDNLNIYFLEMNDCYGDSFIVKYHDFEILVDGGTQTDATYVRQGIKKYVTDGVLDMMIVSHPHNDHTGGIADRNTFREITSIGTVVDYGYKYSTSWNEGYETNRDKYVGLGATYYPIYDLFHNEEYSPIFQIADDLSIEFLDTGLYLPTTETKDSSYNHNDTSVSAVITYKRTKFFFAGDLENKGEANIINNYPNYFSNYHTYYKASHHGSLTSNSRAFMNYMQPQEIFISAAVTGVNMTSAGVVAEQHPYINTLKTFADYTEKVWWNGTSGTISASCDGKKIVKVTGEGATRHYYSGGELVDSESEKDLPFPQTKWYADYMS